MPGYLHPHDQPSCGVTNMNKATAPIIDSKTLGLWIQWVRKAQDLSQENIADASNLSTRTVQRIEAGASTDVGTRRRLAKALGYDDPDVFQTATFAENVTKIFSDLNAA